MFLLLFGLSIPFYIYRVRNLHVYLPQILYYDSSGYNPTTIKAKEFFGVKLEETKHNLSHKETSRELKPDEVGKNNILQLKDNNIELETIQINENDCNMEIRNTNKEGEEKIKIKYNNFTEKADVAKTDKKINALKLISLEDYEKLDYENLYYDKRTFFVTYKDSLIEEHSLFSLIFKRSLMEPFFIRLIKFTFEMSMTFALSAMLFTDKYIEARINNQKSVSLRNKISLIFSSV
jgi:hypothetical protein